ncbi:hypothetical protein SAMN02910298_02254 [Pseudobutyrivibrio sp. YE44]|uniref:hypothetical protein n=1 Tax=Pseudobutyrivibrio sp. YE44 TaxID=1520802 RepID=UPI000881FA91|nr:hypothetical protein [Pseudobutyrivibrio sp. YE44]SDB45121.1 hypothetical protein SAMN02910298_02254 [Pseudobutyrivibrio sp. YE44]
MSKEKNTRKITDENATKDSFYSETNIEHLKKIIAEYESGKTKPEEHNLIELDKK